MTPSSTNSTATDRGLRHDLKPATSSKSRRRRPGTGEIVVPVSLPPDLVRSLQAWASSCREPKADLSRTIRFALREWLMAQVLRRHLGQPGDAMAATGPTVAVDALPDPFGPPDA